MFIKITLCNFCLICRSTVDNTEDSNNLPTAESNTNTREELLKFCEGQMNKNTIRKVEGCAKKFTEFIQNKIKPANFQNIESLAPELLDEYLGTFFKDMRKNEKGDEYEPDTLTSYQHAISVYLQRRDYPFNILKDDEFWISRKCLKAKRTDLKKKGKGNKPNRADSLLEEEEDRLWESGALGDHHPEALQNSIWFYCTKCLGLRGRDECRQLLWGDLKITTHDNLEWLEWDTERCTKTRDGNTNHERAFPPKIFPKKDNPQRCPLRLYRLYASLRPKGMDHPNSPFFMAVNQQYEKYGQWYKRGPLGVHSLGNMLKKMTESAGILQGKRLTNHSARKTMCTDLINAGFAPTCIQQLSGHKSVGSISNYAVANLEMQRKMCDVLTRSTGRPRYESESDEQNWSSNRPASIATDRPSTTKMSSSSSSRPNPGYGQATDTTVPVSAMHNPSRPRLRPNCNMPAQRLRPIPFERRAVVEINSREDRYVDPSINDYRRGSNYIRVVDNVAVDHHNVHQYRVNTTQNAAPQVQEEARRQLDQRRIMQNTAAGLFSGANITGCNFTINLHPV